MTGRDPHHAHAQDARAHQAHHGLSHHAPAPDADRRLLITALALIGAFMLVEVVVGVAASSLALLSDAAHMLTDALALGMSIAALRLAARPAGGAMTFGLRRVEILSAQVNGITLLVLSGVIVYEAVRRLVDPPQVDAWPVLAVALCGALVTLAATSVLARADRRSLNVEGSFQHVLTDLYAFAGTAIAATLVLLTGFDRADPIASLVVAGLMLRSAYALLKASGRVFLEAAPEGLDPDEIGRALASHPRVTEIHDLHVWEVTSGFPALSAHVMVGSTSDCHAARWELERLLDDRFGVRHTTLQVEHEQAPGPLKLGVESPSAESGAH